MGIVNHLNVISVSSRNDGLYDSHGFGFRHLMFFFISLCFQDSFSLVICFFFQSFRAVSFSFQRLV